MCQTTISFDERESVSKTLLAPTRYTGHSHQPVNVSITFCFWSSSKNLNLVRKTGQAFFVYPGSMTISLNPLRFSCLHISSLDGCCRYWYGAGNLIFAIHRD